MPSPTELQFQNRDIKIEIKNAPEGKFNLKDALVEEGLSKITKITAEVLTFDDTVTVEDFLGEDATIIYPNDQEQECYFSGTCVAVEKIGRYMGGMLFILDIRPWLWFLTRKRDSRIFQDKTTVQIIETILGDMNLSGKLEKKLHETYEPREYCVQYRESCYDFICRLMEEEGIYFYFNNEGKDVKLVLADGPQAHSPLSGHETYEFYYPDGGQRDKDHVSYWVMEEDVRTGRVELKDYDFKTPTAEIKGVSEIRAGTHSHGTYEHYDYPGRFRNPEAGGSHLGADRATYRMQSIAATAVVSKGVANIRGMTVGQTFALSKHKFVEDGSEFLIRNATHYIGVDSDTEEDLERAGAGAGNDAEGNILAQKRAKPGDLGKAGMAYRCTFDVIPKDVQFRALQVTPWPEIPGLHTAVVTGDGNEDIYTDEFGRIKVQFHWDREGQYDENTTCFVRVVMPWTGQQWGMISIPRVGNEVVIQFEEGNPDRPICTGMVYNDRNMPPYELNSRRNETGIVTRSTRPGTQGQGTAQTFHELIFDDTLEAEKIRFQSERDYFEIIKNNATITIGMEHQDDGDLTQTIYNHRTETVKQGNHTFTVETGNETYHIEGNQDITVNGNETFTIAGNQDITVDGNETFTIGGNQDSTVSGSTTHDTTGTTLIKAGQKITLECGGSKIEMTPTGIKVTAGKIEMEATGMFNAKAGGMMTVEASGVNTVKSSAALILQGSAVKIN